MEARRAAQFGWVRRFSGAKAFAKLTRVAKGLALMDDSRLVYGELLYNVLIRRPLAMTAEKVISMSFRVSPKFKALLEAAAAQENRSLTNMLETLVFAHCERYGVKVHGIMARNSQGAKR